MDLTEFFNACQHHDWYYHFSDDHGVWSRGGAAERKLKSEAATDETKQAILDAWREFYFSGESFGKPRAPRPRLGDYVPPVSTFPGEPPAVTPEQERLF